MDLLSSALTEVAAGTTADPPLRLRAFRARRADAPLTLTLAPGERMALLGANGVGKTTLLRAILGLTPPASGVIEQRCHSIGYVPQDYRSALFPWFRVRDNLALGFGAGRTRPLGDVARAAVESALRVVPVRAALLDRYPYTLSGGEQQLVVIARAFAAAPRLLVLDEPFAALDAPTRLALIETIVAWTETRGAALILVAHELDTAAKIAHRALVLRAEAPPDALSLRGLDGGRALAALREAIARGREW